ncbi:MAG: TRAM domain-containing protein [Candidatus Krumholzibacteriia bacterium]
MSEPVSPELHLTIEKLVTGGRGLARLDGRAVFVPDTAVGDQVRARVIKDSRNFLEAELLEVLSPGPGRRQPPCPHAERCGGCDLQHLDDAAQEAARREILLDCFRRLGRLEVDALLAPTPTLASLGYRNRLRLSAHPTGRYGLRERQSHAVVPLDTCLVMAEPFTETVLPWLRMLPPMEQIVVRLDGRGGWLLSLYGPPPRLRVLRKFMESHGDESPAPGLQGVLLNNRPVWGRGYLVMQVADHKYRVSHQSFFQGNLAAAELATATARRWLEDVHPEGTDLVDLYCGVGLFLLALADRHLRLLGIEADASAMSDAQENLRRAGLLDDGRGRVVQADVVKALADPDVRGAVNWADACVVADPPRTGLGKDALAALCELRPATVLSMSCDPATLARDTGALVAAGYVLERIMPLPMFPQTAHVETLALLRRQG